MARVDEALRVLTFDKIPSPVEFSSTIEPRNVPAVFKGAVKNWDAITKWDPSNGGLDYFEERVGSANVDAMLSNSAPVFYGDVRSHERVSLPFTTFISSCKHYVQKNADLTRTSTIGEVDSSVSQVNMEDSCSTSSDSCDQIYLAQVSILSTERKEKSPLEVLINDISMPVFLGTKNMVSINLWMNRAQSRSSTHYDPFHNLLCIVAGSKQVVLWPPSACPLLYPMPIHGESSNHSAVDLENPDLSVHTRAKHSMEYSQRIILQSGDALFIPEGWFHQVDSGDMTIAVNLWWKSQIMSNMLEHMDAYYIRRILNRLVGNEMNSLLQRCSVGKLGERDNCENTEEASKGCHEFGSNRQTENGSGNSVKQWPILEQLEPFALNILYELITCVHNAVKVAGQDEAVYCIPLNKSFVSPEGDLQNSVNRSSLSMADPVASILSAIEPVVLKKVLLTMGCQFPRTLEALILHALSPTGAEVLTRKFDEMDRQANKDEQVQFYQLFYSVFDDPNAAMDAIIKGKEAFAFQAVQNVLDQYLGLQVDKPSYLH